MMKSVWTSALLVGYIKIKNSPVEVIKAAWVRGRGVVEPAAITNKIKKTETTAGFSLPRQLQKAAGDLGFWFESSLVVFFFFFFFWLLNAVSTTNCIRARRA